MTYLIDNRWPQSTEIVGYHILSCIRPCVSNLLSHHYISKSKTKYSQYKTRHYTELHNGAQVTYTVHPCGTKSSRFVINCLFLVVVCLLNYI
jgi:hypothetical protein